MIIVSFFFLLFVWCVFSSFLCQTPNECTSLSSVSVSGAPGSHTTYITHKVGVLCTLLLSCLGTSYVVLFSICLYLFLSSSICFLSLYRHSLIGQSTSRLPTSFSSVSVSGAPGSHTTYITHKVGVLTLTLTPNP